MSENINKAQTGPNIHMVNAALIETGRACDTWRQIEQWADLALSVHRHFRSLREESQRLESHGAQQQSPLRGE